MDHSQASQLYQGARCRTRWNSYPLHAFQGLNRDNPPSLGYGLWYFNSSVQIVTTPFKAWVFKLNYLKI